MPNASAILQGPQGDFGGFPVRGTPLRFNPFTGTVGPTNVLGALSLVNGNVVATDGSVGTAGNTGFFYLGSCAGVPTGTPPSFSGRTPVMVDSTNNTMYYYSGGAWIALVNTTGVGGGMVRIGQVVTSSSQATATFSSIPGTYSNLIIMGQSRDTTAGTSDTNVFIQFNSDNTSGNYNVPQALFVASGASGVGTPAVSANGFGIYTHPNDGATAGRAGTFQIFIPNYTSTTFFKQVFGQSTEAFSTNSTNGAIYFRSGEWNSATAITKVVLTSGTAFKDNSVFTLYGLA